MTVGQILRAVTRDRRFWVVTGVALVGGVAARLLIPGWVGEFVSDGFFLGGAFAGGTFARRAAGLPDR